MRQPELQSLFCCSSHHTEHLDAAELKTKCRSAAKSQNVHHSVVDNFCSSFIIFHTFLLIISFHLFHLPSILLSNINLLLPFDISLLVSMVMKGKHQF